MIKLLIVDDEPLVQIGIKSMLDLAEYGIEVCGTAMNGEAAFQMIGEYAPEIVITDIKMPILNGLDLVKKSRETYGQIPLFIMLTSYEEFQLVKQAMSYQVVDYLIKLELDAQSLAESIGRALERLMELKDSEAYRLVGGRPLHQSYSEKFYMRLLHNLFDSREQFEIQKKDLRLEFGDACYIALHGQITSDKADAMNSQQQENLYSSSLEMIREILAKHLPSHVLSLDKRHFAVIFHFSGQKDDTIQSIKEAWENVCHMVHNYFSVRLTAGLGSMVEDPLRINESYQEARQAFNMANAHQPLVTYAEITDSSLRRAFNIALFKNSLTQAFEEFDTDVLYDTISEMISLFASHPMHQLQAVDGACNILYLALSLLPDGEKTMEQVFDGYAEGYRSLYRMNNVEQVNEWLVCFRDGLCEILKSRRKTYKDHVVTNVQKYINSHIEERLTLNDVAAVFGLSSNYLSALFKKTCNIGFSEYITQRKIARAKSLLLEQDMKIYEVADNLGFESAFYFSKVFKKVEGISPREYIQAHLAGPEAYQNNEP